MFKRFLSILVVVAVLCNIVVFADNEEMEDYATEQEIVELDEEYESIEIDQELMDEVNNNALTFSNIDSNISSLNHNGLDDQISLMNDNVESEFTVDDINTVYNLENNLNDSVSLSTGALTYKKQLFSLPGTGGLDFDLSIIYNSGDSVISTNENEIGVHNLDFKNFAVGWGFNIPTIVFNGGARRTGWNCGESIRFPDGSSYTIIGASNGSSVDRSLTLKGYELSDIVLTQRAEDNHIILTYIDGTTYEFEGEYGNLVSKSDKFGNTISFSYTEIEYCRGGFFDYLFNPSAYNGTLNVLTSIVDSAQRRIDFRYNIGTHTYGQSIDSIEILLNSVNIYTFRILTKNTAKGLAYVLESIEAISSEITTYSYEEKASYLSRHDTYYNENSREYMASYILLQSITLPTGGTVYYEYSNYKRAANSIDSCYDVYKILSINKAGEKTYYSYENDCSGYPYSYYSKEDNKIDDDDFTYATSVKLNDKTVVYTFNNKQQKIGEITYDSKKTNNSFVLGYSRALWNIPVGNDIYRIGFKDQFYTQREPVSASTRSKLYLYKQNYINGNTVFLSSLDEMVSRNAQVKVLDGVIYVTDINNNSIKTYKYEITLNRWYNLSEYELGSSAILNNGFSGMYVVGTCLYGWWRNGRSLYNAIYNTVTNQWSVVNNILNSDTTSYNVKFIGVNDSNALFLIGSKLVTFNTINNSKTETELNRTYDTGFILGSEIYGIQSDTVYCIDDDNEYEMPFSYSHVFKGLDGFCYFVSNSIDERSLFDIYKFDVDSDDVFISVGNIFRPGNDYVMIGSTRSPLLCSIAESIEIISLNQNDQENSFTNTLYEYNNYNQVTGVCNYSFNHGGNQLSTSTQCTYVNGQNALLSSTDEKGNVTTYEYTNSPYYIPTNIILYSNRESSIETTNVLSQDGKKISSETIQYSNRAIVKEYNYDSIYPSNVSRVTVSEFENGESTTLYQTEYTYSNFGSTIASETKKNVKTNNSQFSETVIDITKQFTYNNIGKIKTEVDENGNRTSYEYDALGRLTDIEYPNHNWKHITYDVNRYGSIITTFLNEEYYLYQICDEFGRVVEIKDSEYGGSLVLKNKYTYRSGKIYRIYDGNNNFTQYTYDSFGRVNKLQKCSDNVVFTTQLVSYNDYSRSKTIDNGGKTKTFYYDNYGQLIKEEQNTAAGINQISYAYDYMGNKTTIADANGNVTLNNYDDEGRLVSTVNALNQTQNYIYDSYGNVEGSNFNGKNQHFYTYDSLGRKLSDTDALETTEYFAYDGVGNLTKHKDKKNQITSYVYDNAYNLVEKQTVNMNISWLYDLNGNVVSMTDSTGTTNYAYTYDGKLCRITSPDGKSINYYYDDAGNVRMLNDYNHKSFNYFYDGANRLTRISSGGVGLASYSYTRSSEIASIATPEYVSEYTYDNASRVISLTNESTTGDLLNNYVYTYDVLGNQISKVNGTETTSYTYDALSRLTSETASDGTVTSYTFDSGNNIMTKDITHPSTFTKTFNQNGNEYTLNNVLYDSYTYSYNDANQLITETESIAGTGTNYSGFLEMVNSYTYDANGNTLTKTKGGQVDQETVTYGYNELNQLTSFTDANNNTTSYGYDGTGMRVSKTRNNTTTKYYWDRDYIANESIDGVVTATNYISPQGIFARETNNNTEYLLKDGHGNVISTYYLDGVQSNYDYDAYGNRTTTSTNNMPLGYCGEYYDDESGLIYLRNRYYDPSIGRFINEDPIQDGVNWYGYCGGNPITSLDPLGLVFYRNDNVSNSQWYIFYEEICRLTDDEIVFNDSSLDYIEGTIGDNPYGTALIRKVMNNGCKINSGKCNYSQFNEIFINFESHSKTLVYSNLLCKNVIQDTPLMFSIAHELIHQYVGITRITDTYFGIYSYFYDGDLFYDFADMDEIKTVGLDYMQYSENSVGASCLRFGNSSYEITENMIRNEHGVSLRVSYSKADPSYWDNSFISIVRKTKEYRNKVWGIYQ